MSRQRLWGLPYEEAAQAGRQGLWRAILNYDPKRGPPFTSYAYKAIMHYVWAAVQSHFRRMRREVPLGVLALYGVAWAPDPAWLRDQREIRQELHKLVARLPERLRRVLVWLRQPAHSQELRGLLARHTQEQYELAEGLAQAWLRRRGGRHGD